MGNCAPNMVFEAEDEGGVAVLLGGALADHDDGARLDDGDAGHGAVGLEELGAAELAAEDARLGIHGRCSKTRANQGEGRRSRKGRAL